MERGDGFMSGYPNKLARTSSNALTILPRHDSAAINISSSSSNSNIPNEQRQLQCVIREQDQYMPIANVIRIMRRILPPHAKISDDAKETVQECVSEYISFITGEANERCHREQRKTITAEDIIWAMGKLGFDDYVDPLSLFLYRYRHSETGRTSTPMPMRGPVPNVDYGYGFLEKPSGPFGPLFNVGPQQGLYDPSIARGSSSSQATDNIPGFDPFAQFK